VSKTKQQQKQAEIQYEKCHFTVSKSAVKQNNGFIMTTTAHVKKMAKSSGSLGCFDPLHVYLSLPPTLPLPRPLALQEKHNYQTILFGCITRSIMILSSIHWSTKSLHYENIKSLCYLVCYGNYLNDFVQFISNHNANAFHFGPGTEHIYLIQTLTSDHYLTEHTLINIHELRLNWCCDHTKKLNMEYSHYYFASIIWIHYIFQSRNKYI